MYDEKIATFILKRRFILLIALLLITIFFALQLGKVNVTTRLNDLLPQSHSFVKFHNEVRDTFGGANVMFIKVTVKEGDIFNPETLEKIKFISNECTFLPGVDRFKVSAMALKKTKDFRATNWGLEIKALMWPDIPQTKEEIDYLKTAVYSNDMVYGSMVSIDSKSALISMQFREDMELDYPAIFKEVRKLCDEVKDENTETFIAGNTMIRAYIYDYLSQTKIIFGITLLAMVFLLFIYTRTLQMVTMPIISAVLSAVWGLGFVGLVGFNLDPLVFVVPLLITARAISHSVQFNERFIEEYHELGSVSDATHASIKALLFPRACRYINRCRRHCRAYCDTDSALAETGFA